MELKISPSAMGCRGVLADEAEALLVLGGHRVFQPEQAVGLEVLAEPRRFDRGQAMVHVVQQVHVPAHGVAQRLEQFWDQRQVLVVAQTSSDREPADHAAL
jgi:hypothetical protein